MLYSSRETIGTSGRGETKLSGRRGVGITVLPKAYAATDEKDLRSDKLRLFGGKGKEASKGQERHFASALGAKEECPAAKAARGGERHIILGVYFGSTKKKIALSRFQIQSRGETLDFLKKD